MSDSHMKTKLFDMDIHISKELKNLSDKFAAFPEDSLDKERFIEFSWHLDYTDELLKEALPLAREYKADAKDTDLYDVLKAQRSIENNNDAFHRLRNTFLARYVNKQRSQERDMERERVVTFDDDVFEQEEEADEPLFAPDPDVLSAEEEEAIAQEASLAAMEEAMATQEEADAKAAKRKKEAEKQEKFRQAGAAQDAENERLEQLRQEGRRAQAERLGIHVGDDQQLADAQLRDERARQEAQLLYTAQQDAERRIRQNETFEAYRQRMEQSDKAPTVIQYSHNDFNAFGGDPTKQGSDQSAPTYGYTTYGVADPKQYAYEQEQARKAEANAQALGKSQSPYNYDAPPESRGFTPLSTPQSGAHESAAISPTPYLYGSAPESNDYYGVQPENPYASLYFRTPDTPEYKPTYTEHTTPPAGGSQVPYGYDKPVVPQPGTHTAPESPTTPYPYGSEFQGQHPYETQPVNPYAARYYRSLEGGAFKAPYPVQKPQDPVQGQSPYSYDKPAVPTGSFAPTHPRSGAQDPMVIHPVTHTPYGSVPENQPPYGAQPVNPYAARYYRSPEGEAFRSPYPEQKPQTPVQGQTPYPYDSPTAFSGSTAPMPPRAGALDQIPPVSPYIPGNISRAQLAYMAQQENPYAARYYRAVSQNEARTPSPSESSPKIPYGIPYVPESTPVKQTPDTIQIPHGSKMSEHQGEAGSQPLQPEHRNTTQNLINPAINPYMFPQSPGSKMSDDKGVYGQQAVYVAPEQAPAPQHVDHKSVLQSPQQGAKPTFAPHVAQQPYKAFSPEPQVMQSGYALQRSIPYMRSMPYIPGAPLYGIQFPDAPQQAMPVPFISPFVEFVQRGSIQASQTTAQSAAGIVTSPASASKAVPPIQPVVPIPGATRPYFGGASFHYPTQGIQSPLVMSAPVSPKETQALYLGQIPNFSAPTPNGMQSVTAGSAAGLALAQEMLRQYKSSNMPGNQSQTVINSLNVASWIQGNSLNPTGKDLPVRSFTGPVVRDTPKPNIAPVSSKADAIVKGIPGHPEHVASTNTRVVLPQTVKLTNKALYDSVSANSPMSPQTPSKISPVVEQQMVMNMNAARLKFHNATTQEKAREAAKEYRSERDALMKLRGDIKNGRFVLEAAKPANPVPAPPAKGSGKGDTVVFFAPTPVGVTSKSFSHTHPGTSTSTHMKHQNVTRAKERYTPQNPMHVTPVYDQAIATRYQNAKANIAQLMKENRNNPGFKVPHTVEKEFILASEAFLGYNLAKNRGTVVVDKTAQRNIPDFSAWQQRHRAANSNFNLGTITGTTMQGRSQNANKVNKANVVEETPGFGNESLLKRKSLKKAYAQKFGYKLEHYSRQAVSRFSRKFYQMMQNNDDDGAAVLSTLESGRYYTVTSLQVIYALSHLKTIDTTGMAKAAAKEEFRLFGNLSQCTDKELALLIKNGGDKAKDAQKLLDLRRTRDLDLKTGLELEKEFKNKSPKARLKIVDERLQDLDKKHYKKQARSFSEKGTQKRLDRELEKFNHKKALDKFKKDPKGVAPKPKFGREVSFSTKGKNILIMTPKSIDAEIESLKKQGSEIKALIKKLQAKGSALSQAERKTLVDLLIKRKEIDAQIHSLLGFKTELATFTGSRAFHLKLYDGISRNMSYFRSGAYMIYGLVLRPMQQSDMVGVQGLVKMANISTNHYVHVLAKNTLKYGYKTGAWAARKTGVARASRAASAATRAAARSAAEAVNNTKVVTNTKHVIHSQVKRVRTTSQQAVRTAKSTVSKMTPQKIRTAKRSINAANAVVKSRFDTVATGINNAVFKAKAWAVNTKAGQSILRFNRALNSFGKSISAGLNIFKSVALKAIGGYLLVFFLIALVCAGASALFSGSASTVILSPNSTEDGAIDLKPYVEILSDAKFDLNEKFSSMGSKYDDYRVDYISNYDNTKEILSMMAVYLSQDLDIKNNPNVEKYLNSLFDDSHPYSTTVEEYRCDGCKTKRVSVGHDSDCPDDCTKSHKVTRKYCDGHKRLIITVSVLGFDEIFDADSMGNEGHTATAGEKLGNFTITYYCTEQYPHICNAGPPYKTKMGTTPTEGRTIAADISMPGLSLGSHVIIDGHEYVVEDIGGGVNGYHIDMVVEGSHENALSKGKRTGVPVYAATYTGESMEESGEWNGWTEDNREWVKLIYNTNWTELYSGVSDYDGYIETGDLIVEGEYTWPVTNTTESSGYGWRIHPVTGERSFHKGTDIAIPVGTPVHAAADGTVTTARYSSTAGNFVVINHGGGVVTRYLHNSEMLVSAGDKVKAGDVIAISGNSGRTTGPHLHFEFIVNGTPIDPRKQYGLD